MIILIGVLYGLRFQGLRTFQEQRHSVHVSATSLGGLRANCTVE